MRRVQRRELGRQVERPDLGAGLGKMLPRGIEGAARFGPCLVPIGCAAQGDAWIVRGARVAGIPVRLQHDAPEQSEIRGAAGEPADRVERPGELLDAGEIGAAARRLRAEDAAERCRADDRAAGLRPEGERRHEGGDGGGGAARRAARRPRRIMRVGGAARCRVGEFGGHGLAENDGAGRTHLRDAGGVALRAMAAIDRRAVAGRHVGGVEEVLHRDRNAVQRSAGAAPCRRRVPGPAHDRHRDIRRRRSRPRARRCG